MGKNNPGNYSPETISAAAMFERLPQDVRVAMLEFVRELAKDDTKIKAPTERRNRKAANTIHL